MSQSLSLLYIHIVFPIENPFIRIQAKDADILYHYIGNVLKKHDSLPVCIGGMSDHIHILFVLTQSMALTDLSTGNQTLQ
ncbi:MAG: transposase [Tannerellaceae bacterium]|nr:transposase [Tannerellaceae bacterium]